MSNPVLSNSFSGNVTGEGAEVRGTWPLCLAALERRAILEALRRTKNNRTHAARLLGISLRTLRNKVRLLRLAGDLTPDGQIPPDASPDDMFEDTNVACESQEESAA